MAQSPFVKPICVFRRVLNHPLYGAQGRLRRRDPCSAATGICSSQRVVGGLIAVGILGIFLVPPCWRQPLLNAWVAEDDKLTPLVKPVTVRAVCTQVDPLCRRWFGPRSRASSQVGLVARTRRSPKDLAETDPAEWVDLNANCSSLEESQIDTKPQSLTTSQLSSGLKRSMYLTIASVAGPRSVS